MRSFMIFLSSAFVYILPSCGSKEKDAEKYENISVDFTYLKDAGYDYASRYLLLPDNELIRQDFLLDVRSRIDRLYYEVSPTHAAFFERAFSDSARISAKI